MAYLSRNHKTNKNIYLLNFLVVLFISNLVTVSSLSTLQKKYDNQHSNKNPIQNLQQDLIQLATEYKKGFTSKAFSLAIKIHIAVLALQQSLNLNHQLLQQQLFLTKFNITGLSVEEKSSLCQQALKQIVEYIQAENAYQQFQHITNRLEFLQNFCTNRDFSYNAKDNEKINLKGKDPMKCAICVVLIQVLRNYASIHAADYSNFIQKQLCQHFQGTIQPTCQAFIHYAGPTLIKALMNRQTADVSCLKLGFCFDPKCKIAQSKASLLQFEQFQDTKPAPWDWLVHLFVQKFGNQHFSPFDLDNDAFSDVSTFRGYDWRGVDCDQLSNKIYPGRKTHSNQILDNDCNGIYGIESLKQSYEDKFCSQSKTGSKRLGVAVIGDSAGAHFSIPQRYMNASLIKKGTYNDILQRIANQLDMPYYSAYTGHRNSTQNQKTHSIYKYLRNWNLCNNNDYQNIAVNGGQCNNTQENIKALKRDQQNDYPLLVFLEMIGNDVCVKSFDQMTTVEHFRQNVLKLLSYLDSKLPKGSHLVIFGFADGDLLFDYLHDSKHPLGVTYADVYDFLNCLNISPCWGWLNTNETVRQYATARAKNLSNVYKQIVKSGKIYQNFDIQYYDFPTIEIMDEFIKQGGNPRNLIEKCDGFHPNTQFNTRFADWIWYKLKTDHPEWIGKQNPFNSQIKKAFGLKDLH